MPPPATPGPRPDGSCAFRDADTGSSCESLAANCGIDLAAFTFLNPIDCQDIQPNQRFCCSRGVKPTRAPKQLPNGGCFPYTVRDQDSCESLAASHDLTVAQIEQWNAGTFHWQGCGNLWTDTAMCLSPGTPPKPAIDPQAECGPTSVGDKHCPLSLCCGPAGYCGSTPEFCAPATGFPCIYDCGMATIPTTDGSAFQRRVGYYTSWAASRAIKPVRPEDLALAGYTHVNYAFAVITNGNLAFDSEEDAAVAQRLLARKKEFPSLKILISVGGWSFSEDDATKMIFSQVFSSPGSRAQFINSVNSFLGTWGFDGLDIDFEYPAAMERNGPIEDVKNLAAFWREARAGMRGNYLLTAALPADAWFLKGYDIPSLRDNTDFLNLMSYDYHGPWDATSAGAWDPTAYMKANPQTSQLSIEASTLLYRKAGIPLEKVNLGIAFYGRNYKLSDPSCGHYGCGMTGAGAAGPASGEGACVVPFTVPTCHSASVNSR
ncbi:glycoside hydrolase superfamily [Geranomyces variabilis]|nr:glycoside hydrolase superfamily [Geranomyces variabilis]